MVVNGQDLFGHPPIMEVFGPFHDQINDTPRLLMTKVLLDQFGTPARVNKMIKTGPWNIQFLNEVKNTRDLTHVQFVYGKAKSDLEPHFLTVSDAGQCILEGP